jgi:lipid A 3-O-deacylase
MAQAVIQVINVSAVLAADNSDQTFNLIVENDSFLDHSDEHYTSGLYLSRTSGELKSCEWCPALSSMMLAPGADAAYRYNYFFGQSIFTPSNISSKRLNPRERPFAGWLFAGARFHRESDHLLDTISATVGVIGPLSAADAVQRWWHSLSFVRGIEPNGWVNQLKNEPGLVLSAHRIWRVPIPAISIGSVQTELLPTINGSVGNVFTYAAAGATFRIGTRLESDWGPARVEPALTGSDYINYGKLNDFGMNIYAGFEGRAVLRNITLDGNSFVDSPNVAKYPMVADLTVGAEMLMNWVSLRAGYTLRSKEFRTQRKADEFLSFNIAIGH